MPFSRPSEARFMASFTAATVAGLPVVTVRSTREPFATGTRTAMPSVIASVSGSRKVNFDPRPASELISIRP